MQATLTREITDPEAAEELSVVELVEQIRAGRLKYAKLPAEARRRCVEHLTEEGFSAVDIGSFLSVCERTIQRDRAELRRLRAIEPSLTLSNEMLGEFFAITQANLQHMTRLANDPSTPAYTRFWAFEAMTRMYDRLMDTARKLGYLEHGHLRRSQLRMQRDDPGAIFMRNMHKLTEFAAHAKIVQSLEAHAKRCQARRAAAAANPPREEARDEALS